MVTIVVVLLERKNVHKRVPYRSETREYLDDVETRTIRPERDAQKYSYEMLHDRLQNTRIAVTARPLAVSKRDFHDERSSRKVESENGLSTSHF